MPESLRRRARDTPAALRRQTTATRLAELPVPRNWIVVAINACLIVLLLGFAATLVPGLTAFELQVVAGVSSSRSALPDTVASAIATLFAPAANILIVAALFFFLLLARRAPINAFASCFVVSVGWLSTQAVKTIVARPRPPQEALPDALLTKVGDSSFPSGHAAFITALVVGLVLLAQKRRRLVAVLGAVAVGIVAASRVYAGAHYPTDVVGGILTALTASLAAAGIWNLYGQRLLARMRFLGRFGPLVAPGYDQPLIHRATFMSKAATDRRALARSGSATRA